jgi:hypothetical protein
LFSIFVCTQEKFDVPVQAEKQQQQQQLAADDKSNQNKKQSAICNSQEIKSS